VALDVLETMHLGCGSATNVGGMILDSFMMKTDIKREKEIYEKKNRIRRQSKRQNHRL